MSIYSGFATRAQEENYDDIIDSVLYILQKRVCKFYQGEPADDDKFINMLVKLHHQMRGMETHKYLEPKSSHTIDELVSFLRKKQIKEASVKKTLQSQPDSIHDSELCNPIHPVVKIHSGAPSHKHMKGRNAHKENDGQAWTNPQAKSSDKNTKNQQAKFVSKRRKSQHISAPKIMNETLGEQHIPLQHFKSKNRIRSRTKHAETLNLRSQGEARGQHLDDMRALVQNYISKTRKSYNKDFNKREEALVRVLDDLIEDET